MSMRQLYQIFCETENALVQGWSTTPITTCPNNAAHIVNLESVVCISQNPPISALYDVVVDITGEGNYTSIAQAFQDGFSNVFVKNGTYTESSDIVIPDRGRLEGETPGGVLVILASGASIKADGSLGISQSVGTISITKDSKTVTGSGTSFSSLNVNDFILIGNNYLQINSIASDTSLQLLNKYRGPTKSGQPYIAQKMLSGVSVLNLTVTGSSNSGLYLRALRFSNIRSVVIVQSAHNLKMIDCGDVGLEAFMSMNSMVGPSVSIQNCIDVFISYCDILNNAGHGVEIINNSDNVTFVSGSISSNGGHGIYIGDTSSNISVLDANIRQNASSGVYVDTNSTNNIIDGCTLINNTTGVSLQGTDNTICACNIFRNNLGVELKTSNSLKSSVIESSVGNGADILGNDCIVEGTRIKSNGGIGIHATGNDGIFTGNRVYNNTGNGFQIDNTANDNIVTSNNFKGNTGTNYVNNGVNTQNNTNLSV